MAGISIILGGDLGPLLEAFARLRAMVRRLAQQISLALRPVRVVFSTVFNGARIAAQTAFRAITGTARAAASSIRSAFSGLKSALPGAGMVGGLIGVAGTAGAIAAAVSQFKVGSDIAAHFERTRISLVALTGSAAEAERVLMEMRRIWQLTGMTVEDQAATIQKFIALGFSPDDSLKLQRNILDIAGAVGMTASNAELLGSALAQVKAKGVVSMEELRQQIAEKGIPVFEELAAKIGVTEGALIAMVSNGEVKAKELLEIFLNMEGSFSRFRGCAERMGTTFTGLVGSLRAAWQLLLADFAAPINDALKPMLRDGIAAFTAMRAQAAGIGRSIGDALLAAFALVKGGRTKEVLGAVGSVAFQSAVEVLMRGLRGAVAFLATALPPIFDAAVATLKDPRFWKGIGNLLSGIGKLFAAEILAVLPGFGNKSKAASLRQQGLTEQYVAEGQIQSSGRGVDMAEVISSALGKGGVAAAAAASGPISKDLKDAFSKWKEISDSVVGEVRRMNQASASPDAAPAVARAGFVEGVAGAIGEAMTVAVGSMARIGGGGYGLRINPMVTQQQRSNEYLRSIDKRLAAAPRQTTAVFA
jgi:tape measure domain-containing protein